MFYIFYNSIISMASIGLKLNEEKIAVTNIKKVIVYFFKWIAIDSIIAIVVLLIFSVINNYLVKKEKTGLLKVFAIFSIVILTFCIIKAIIMCI